MHTIKYQRISIIFEDLSKESKMSSYEIGIEVKKVIDQILKEMVIQNDFDGSLVEFINQPKVPEAVASLFKRFLETSKRKRTS